jgi:GTP cyclohydrolase I
MKMRKITHNEIFTRCNTVGATLKNMFPGKDTLLCYPVPRGGVPAAYALGEALFAMNCTLQLVDTPDEADFIFDDLIDSGRTAANYPNKPFLVLCSKRPQDDDLAPDEWVVFPWESGAADDADPADGGEDIPVRLLQYVGEDAKRGGLVDTPKRFLKAWKFWTSGYDKDPADILKVFKDGAEKCDEMVLVKNIPFYSQCEHHLAPFFGTAHVAYIPNGSIVGLSKLSRLVDMYARRLQVQERLTNQIAHALHKHLKPLGVAVVINARHMCMESRGVCQQGHSTTTSSMLGVFRTSDSARMEFLELIK